MRVWGLRKQTVISNNNFPGNRNRACWSLVVALQIKILALRIYTADSIRLFISFRSGAVCLWVLRGGVVAWWWWLVYNYKVRAIRKLAQYRPSIKIQLTVRQLIFLQLQSMNCECGGIRFISFLLVTTDLEINLKRSSKIPDLIHNILVQVVTRNIEIESKKLSRLGNRTQEGPNYFKL